jgi:hypothetical protein
MKMRYPGIVLILGCLCSPAFAQNAPSGEVFGGYSYVNADIQSGVPSSNPIPRQNANGWEGAASFNVNRWFAVEGDFAGYYKDVSLVTAYPGLPDLKVHDYSFAGGPRASYRQRSTTVFAHVLFGGDSLGGSIAGLGSGSQTSFATVIGGGVEWRVRTRSRWAIRGSGDYVLSHHNITQFFGGPTSNLTQNNFRASVGVVYVFGGVRERAPRQEEPSTPKQSSQCRQSTESALLALVGCTTPDGFLVTSVHPGPGASAGIKPGDFVTAIDDREVHSSSEIDTAIGDKTTVKVSHMITGAWLAEHQVKVR